jgi:hypothetical protein
VQNLDRVFHVFEAIAAAVRQHTRGTKLAVIRD